MLLGDGAGALSGETSAPVTRPSVAVRDFNGDRDPDLAVANGNSDTVSVLLGGGGGSFGGADRLPHRRRTPIGGGG